MDSTYILPGFGISVTGLSKRDLMLLEKLLIDGKISLYYSPIIWIEVLPKIYRLKRFGKLLLSEEDIADRIVAVENTFVQVNPTHKAIVTAYMLRELGHRDMVDNMLYGIALSRDLLLMSMDNEFKVFLHSKNMNTSMILSHNELFNMIQHGK